MAALAHSPAMIMRQALIDLGLAFAGPTVAWSAFVGFMPDEENTHDSVLAINNTGGLLDGKFMGTGEVVVHHGVQIASRSLDSESGWAKMDTIATTLDAQARLTVTVSATDYLVHAFSRQSGVLYLGREGDGSRKWALFTSNWAVTLDQQ